MEIEIPTYSSEQEEEFLRFIGEEIPKGERYFSDYLNMAFLGRKKIVRNAIEKFEQHHVEFDTIIGQGLSGSLVAPLLADALGKSFAIVRKDGATSHGTYPVEGIIGAKWIMVDDFIASGNTVRNIYDKVTNFTKSKFIRTELVGGYFYVYNEFKTEKNLIRGYF